MIPYEKRGCVISLDNSWRITVDYRMHITCCACAYQLLCKRTTVVVRPKILSFSTTYTMFFNNISVIFQQKEGESLTYDPPSLLKSDTQLILSCNIILKLIIPILQPFGNIFPIFHKALFLLF